MPDIDHLMQVSKLYRYSKYSRNKICQIFKISISGVAPTIWRDFAGKHLAGIQHVSNTAGENTKRFKTKIHKIQKFAYLPPFLVLCGRNLLPAWHPSLQVRTSLLHHVMDSRRKRIILCLCPVLYFSSCLFLKLTLYVCSPNQPYELPKNDIWWKIFQKPGPSSSRTFHPLPCIQVSSLFFLGFLDPLSSDF